MDEYKNSRLEKQPIEFPSAGSTFKRGTDFITAKLIDECGLKGYTVGGAKVSEKHAGFVINTGNATLTGIDVISSNTAFTIENAPSSIEAGETATVTIVLNANSATFGKHEGTITVSAPNQTTKNINVSGFVLDPSKLHVDFRTSGGFPKTWTNGGYTYTSWSGTIYSSEWKQLITSKLIVEEGEKLYISAKRYASSSNAEVGMNVYYKENEEA